MKKFLNCVTKIQNAERHSTWRIVDEKNALLASGILSEAEAKYQSSKIPGSRYFQGWTEGGYNIYIGDNKVAIFNHTGFANTKQKPDWEAKATFWLPTYDLAEHVALQLTNI